MSNTEKIKAEIERLKKILEESTYYLDNSQQALGYSFALDDFKEFIDSLPEEKPLTVEDIKTILDLSFWNSDSEKILEEYNRLCDTSKVIPR